MKHVMRTVKPFHEIYEVATEQVIYRDTDYDSVKSYSNFLKRGGAFSGITPSFILINFEIPESDTDDEE